MSETSGTLLFLALLLLFGVAFGLIVAGAKRLIAEVKSRYAALAEEASRSRTALQTIAAADDEPGAQAIAKAALQEVKS